MMQRDYFQNCFCFLKAQDKSLNILKTKRAFKMKQKAYFIIFKALRVAKTYLRPEKAPLKPNSSNCK